MGKILNKKNSGIIINDAEVHLWRYLHDELIPRIEIYFNLLSDEEQNYIEKIKVPEVKYHRILSRAVTKLIISKYLGVSASKIKFENNEYGKPFIAASMNQHRLNFNLTHSANLGLIAITKTKDVGIDVEHIRDLDEVEELINIYLSSYEKVLFNGLNKSEKTKIFYKIWTGKEAFIKAIGKGFSFPVENISFHFDNSELLTLKNISEYTFQLNDWKILNFNPLKNYTSTLAVNMNSFVIKDYKWNSDEKYIN